MKVSLFRILSIIITGIIVSCSTTDSGPSFVINNKDVIGVVQKGPFINGTSVRISELRENLNQTGNVFGTEIVNDVGSFTVTQVNLVSRFVELTADGFYFDEVKGEISAAPLTLRGIADVLDIGTVNVNILTHLERPRIRKLIEDGKSFNDASKQAGQELLSAFGYENVGVESSDQLDITDGGEASAMLLAISVILQGNRSVGELTELLAVFSSDFAPDGMLTDLNLLNTLRETAAGLNVVDVRENLINRYAGLGVQANIPEIETMLNRFLESTGSEANITQVNYDSITDQSVKFSGLVNPNGAVTNVVFEYGISEQLGSTISVEPDPISGINPVEVRVELTDLLPNTTYYFRMKAENSNGVSSSDIQSFSTLKKFSLDITVIGNGIVEEEVVNTITNNYMDGKLIQLTALPSDDWVFYGWSGDLSGSENSTAVEMNSDKSITAIFRSVEELLTIVIDGDGSVAVEQRSISNNPSRTAIRLTAAPSEKWYFDKWDGDFSSNLNSINIQLTEETHMIAKFNPTFSLHENGVTILCHEAEPGEKGFVNGIEYEAVDSQLLKQKTDQGLDLTKVCTSLVTDMSLLFINSDFNQDISSWDLSSVTNISGMFTDSSFNQPISLWDVSNVFAMEGLFMGSSFNQDISEWDVKNVEYMNSMFSGSSFNRDIGNWNVSSAIDMGAMFRNSSFNQDLSRWCVIKIGSEPDGFSDGTDSWVLPKPIWGTCPD